MIVVILGSKAAGYYANYLSLFTLYGLFAFPLIGILFPIMTELITKKHTEKIQLLLSILYKYFSVFGLMIGAFLAVL
jgi:O-antigen/teichoic acid export membrane protein